MTTITNSFFWKLPTSWPNTQTLRTSTTLIVNIAAKAIQSSLCSVGVHLATSTINALGACCIRPITIGCALYDKRYTRVALELLALGSLLSPPTYGQIVCLAVDLISEALNFYEKSQESNSQEMVPVKRQATELFSTFKWKDKLDPKNPVEALKILNIPEEEAHNIDYITAQYEKLKNNHTKKIQKISSGAFAELIKDMLEEVELAYKTLNESLPVQTNQ
ncbi:MULTISPECIES: hypothetical protein [Parachlamydia]|jgi:hypothetical protein|uniref:Uncharacterized protein n=2 Tax=Parachlamydia acanthamoebae TaxID=83552 RepID=F8KXY6_PARAV|nr:hypothetical protein [Parachlamydia acanthamoebae]KIA78548.1 hypothetical protein DB43_DU00150 [Parachlamydia acanthamoebae]CCB85719.1 putative uncharacterized protein [Parachlamydia acanthamoebae UV-7]